MINTYLFNSSLQIWNRMQKDESSDFVPNSDWQRRLNRIVIENIENPDFSNIFLARRMNVSESHFYRLVKEQTGKSPNKYIRELRLNLAKEMIESGNFDRVSLVAYKVGFQRVDYFSRLFERQFGVRPIELI